MAVCNGDADHQRLCFAPVMPGAALCIYLLLTAGCADRVQNESRTEILEHEGSTLQVALANPGYELWDANGNCPVAWQCSQHAGETSFVFLPEYTDRIEGSTSMRIERIGSQPWAAVRQVLKPEQIRGERVRLSAKMKLSEVTGQRAGIMLVASGSIKTPTQNYQNYVEGTAGWQLIEVEGNIPTTVSRVTLGVMSEGDGVLLVDDVRLEILPPE
jgi:hypothetical protein